MSTVNAENPTNGDVRKIARKVAGALTTVERAALITALSSRTDKFTEWLDDEGARIDRAIQEVSGP